CTQVSVPAGLPSRSFGLRTSRFGRRRASNFELRASNFGLRSSEVEGRSSKLENRFLRCRSSFDASGVTKLSRTQPEFLARRIGRFLQYQPTLFFAADRHVLFRLGVWERTFCSTMCRFSTLDLRGSRIEDPCSSDS